MASARYDREIAALRADLGYLRDDLARLTRAMGGDASQALKARGGHLRRTGENLGEGLGRVAAEARQCGRDSVSAVGEHVERRPVTSLCVAFGVGLALGRLLDRP